MIQSAWLLFEVHVAIRHKLITSLKVTVAKFPEYKLPEQFMQVLSLCHQINAALLDLHLRVETLQQKAEIYENKSREKRRLSEMRLKPQRENKQPAVKPPCFLDSREGHADTMDHIYSTGCPESCTALHHSPVQPSPCCRSLLYG